MVTSAIAVRFAVVVFSLLFPRRTYVVIYARSSSPSAPPDLALLLRFSARLHAPAVLWLRAFFSLSLSGLHLVDFIISLLFFFPIRPAFTWVDVSMLLVWIHKASDGVTMQRWGGAAQKRKEKVRWY